MYETSKITYFWYALCELFCNCTENFNQGRGSCQILTAPKLGVFERLSSSKPTIIEFTPTQTGEIPFHCSMAMTTRDAKFIVV